MIDNARWHFFAVPLRYASDKAQRNWGYRLPVGFARARSARSTHGYVLIAANAAHNKRDWGYRLPVGFARARGARSTHGYALIAANAAHNNR
ncbi:MAG: hypothetical protein IKP00_01730 [Victivallales bacterium]|nr:hypothetical protein [Victivallales bacterium]